MYTMNHTLICIVLSDLALFSNLTINKRRRPARSKMVPAGSMMFLSCGQSHGAQSHSVIYLYYINARVNYLVRGLMENNLIMWLNLTCV